MGNTATNPDLEQLGMLPDQDELNNTFRPQHHFIIHFHSVSNIPPSEYTSECRPYIRAFIGLPTELNTGDFSFTRLSSTVSTPIKADHAEKSAIWQCYRDFYVKPPPEAFLVVEIVNAKYEAGDSDVLGTAFIPIIDFVDDTMRTYMITYSKNRTVRADIPFTITLRRVYVDKSPPKQKIIFLVRHGESKWNKAQANVNIGGLLNRDHALTATGINQAIELNERWKAIARTVSALENVNEDWESYAVPVPEVEKNDDDDDDEEEVEDYDDEYEEDGEEEGGEGEGDDHTSHYTENATTNTLLDLDFEVNQSPQSVSIPTPSNSAFYLPIDTLSPTHINNGDNSDVDNHINNTTITSNDSNVPIISPIDKPKTPRSPKSDIAVVRKNKSSKVTTISSSDPKTPTGNKSTSITPRPSLSPHRASPINENSLLDMSGLDTITSLSTDKTNENINSSTLSISPIIDQEFLNDHGLLNSPSNATDHMKEDHTLSSTEKILLQDSTNMTSVSVTSEQFRAMRGGIPSTRFITSEEAVEARRNEYIRKFLHADAVYSSPLTRAIQTAFMVMDGHPAAEQGLTLYSHLREIKKLGGLDSVGMVYGNDIEDRVKAELTQVIGKYRTEEVMIESLHYNDCNSPWWTSISSYESETEQQDRVREFISFVRYSDSNLPVYVGHSLFFKAFYSKRISNMLRKNRPELSANMKRYRLSNATLMALTIQFIDRPFGCDAIILDADLIFGGGFHGGMNQDDDDSGGNVISMGGNSSGHDRHISPHHGISPLSGSIDVSSAGAVMLEKFGSFRIASANAVGNAAESISSRLSHHGGKRPTISEIKSEVKSMARKFIDGLK